MDKRKDYKSESSAFNPDYSLTLSVVMYDKDFLYGGGIKGKKHIVVVDDTSKNVAGFALASKPGLNKKAINKEVRKLDNRPCVQYVDNSLMTKTKRKGKNEALHISKSTKDTTLLEPSEIDVIKKFVQRAIEY